MVALNFLKIMFKLLAKSVILLSKIKLEKRECCEEKIYN